MVEDLQSEESDDDDSSSGEEAAVKANPVSRDSRWYRIMMDVWLSLFPLVGGIKAKGVLCDGRGTEKEAK